MLSQDQIKLLESLKETPRSFESMNYTEQILLGGALRPESEGFAEQQLALMANWRLLISPEQLELATAMIDPVQMLDALETLPIGEAMSEKLYKLGYLSSPSPEQTVKTLHASFLTDMRPGNNWFGCAVVLRSLPLIELGPEYFPQVALEGD